MSIIVDSSAYNGICSCGREHSMVTQAAVIEKDSLLRFEELTQQYGIGGKCCALYGENSYAATADRHPKAEQEIVLRSEELHSDEKSTAEVLERLEKDVEVLIAVGSGTIHDIARFCAHKRGIRFVSCPTAASVDGFCSNVAAMTWYGYKKTVNAVAPEIVIADSEIIKNAPFEMVCSGVGDIMAKYTALAEWEISHAVTGEYLCRRTYEITRSAADTVMKSVLGLLCGEYEAFENVTYALLMSGIAMQMMGNSRPASGAEHHISHMIEMGPKKFEVLFPAMHGEKTGVGTILAAKEYYRMAETEDISQRALVYKPVSDTYLLDFFGEELAESVIDENREDCLAQVTPEALVKNWQRVREIIWKIPPPETLYAQLEKLEAKRDPEDIGITSNQIETLLEYSPLVRNRVTLMRMRRMLNL